MSKVTESHRRSRAAPPGLRVGGGGAAESCRHVASWEKRITSYREWPRPCPDTTSCPTAVQRRRCTLPRQNYLLGYRDNIS